jgi:hypothetical protein
MDILCGLGGLARYKFLASSPSVGWLVHLGDVKGQFLCDLADAGAGGTGAAVRGRLRLANNEKM